MKFCGFSMLPTANVWVQTTGWGNGVLWWITFKTYFKRRTFRNNIFLLMSQWLPIMGGMGVNNLLEASRSSLVKKFLPLYASRISDCLWHISGQDIPRKGLWKCWKRRRVSSEQGSHSVISIKPRLLIKKNICLGLPKKARNTKRHMNANTWGKTVIKILIYL